MTEIVNPFSVWPVSRPELSSHAAVTHIALITEQSSKVLTNITYSSEVDRMRHLLANLFQQDEEWQRNESPFDSLIIRAMDRLFRAHPKLKAKFARAAACDPPVTRRGEETQAWSQSPPPSLRYILRQSSGVR